MTIVVQQTSTSLRPIAHARVCTNKPCAAAATASSPYSYIIMFVQTRAFNHYIHLYIYIVTYTRNRQHTRLGQRHTHDCAVCVFSYWKKLLFDCCSYILFTVDIRIEKGKRVFFCASFVLGTWPSFEEKISLRVNFFLWREEG